MTPIQGLKRIARERSRDSVRDFWSDHRGFIAWIVLVLVIGISQIQLYVLNNETHDAVGQVENERSSRINALNSVNVFFCQANNQQDRILGKLLAITLEGAPPADQLTEEQRVQLRAFRRAERNLNEPTDCKELALKLADALGIPREDVRISPIIGVSIEGFPNIITEKKKKNGGSGQDGTAPTRGSPDSTSASPEENSGNSGGGSGGNEHTQSGGGGGGTTHVGGHSGGSGGGGGDGSVPGNVPGSTTGEVPSAPSAPSEGKGKGKGQESVVEKTTGAVEHAVQNTGCPALEHDPLTGKAAEKIAGC